MSIAQSQSLAISALTEPNRQESHAKRIRVPQKEVGKRSSITFFFAFETLLVTFWSLFLMFLSLFSSLFCQTPFPGLLLRHDEGGRGFGLRNRSSKSQIASDFPSHPQIAVQHYLALSRKSLAILVSAMGMAIANRKNRCDVGALSHTIISFSKHSRANPS